MNSFTSLSLDRDGPPHPVVGVELSLCLGVERGTTSVDNGLRLLALLGEPQALRVAEAADVLGVARSTAHRLLSTLRRHGFAVQDRPTAPIGRDRRSTRLGWPP